MAILPFPIDYAGIRAALAQGIQLATGLTSDQVLQMQAYENAATRPDPPFAAFMLTGLGQPFGRDARVAGQAGELDTFQGMRQLTAQVQFFGRTTDEAFGLASLWVAGCYYPAVTDLMFSLGDLAVWSMDGPTNASQLTATEYEPRAAVNGTFGVCSVTYDTLPQVQQVPISGIAGQADVPQFETP